MKWFPSLGASQDESRIVPHLITLLRLKKGKRFAAFALNNFGSISGDEGQNASHPLEIRL